MVELSADLEQTPAQPSNHKVLMLMRAVLMLSETSRDNGFLELVKGKDLPPSIG